MSAIRVGSTWLQSIAPVGDVVVEWRWPGGCWTLEWSMALAPGQHPPALKPGEIVQWHSGGVAWTGRLGTPDWDGGRFTADGLCRDGETAQAVDGSDVATAHPGAAINAARARGAITWQQLEAFASVADTPPEIQSLSALLDAYCDQTGRRWAVDERQAVYTATDPTTPALHVAPGVGDLGATSEAQVTHLTGHYQTTAGGFARVQASAAAPDGRRIERSVDLIGRGRMTTAQAQATVDGIVARAGGPPRLTSGVEVPISRVSWGRGATASAGSLRAGRMVRVHGVTDPRSGMPWTDFVVGQCRVDMSAQTVLLVPTEVVAGDLASIIESVGGVLL